MATYNFGIIGETNLDDGTYGLLQSLSKTTSGEEATAKDGSGNTADYKLYDETIEYQAEYIIDSEITVPSRDDIIVVGTDKYVLTQVVKNQNNSEYHSGTFTLKRWTSNGIPSNI